MNKACESLEEFFSQSVICYVVNGLKDELGRKWDSSLAKGKDIL